MALPVTLVSGYLGAGKTTLINHLLRNAGGRRLMVMVNDFGELPIDADLIESADGDTITLANGCICCSIGADLAGAFMDLLERGPLPDHLLIEASGVAEPHRIANLARAEPDLELRAIVVLADATSVVRQAADPMVGETVHKQLGAADLLLLNKIDLLSPEAAKDIQTWLADNYANLRTLSVVNAQIAPEVLEDPQTSSSAGVEPQPGSHEDLYMRWSHESAEPLDRSQFEAALKTLPPGLLRLKGLARFAGAKETFVVQCVGARCSLAPSPETQVEGCRLVAIGLKANLAPDDLNRLFGLGGQQ